MTDASELARALAARRRRATFVCEVCGAEYEAWDRKPTKQPARTCSSKCRQQLYRDRKRAVSVREPHHEPHQP